ncbi:hypothetical protein [Moraxella sp. VT-16-12]|nr:hypothetical protein [Moraxella sp. VT-16-12]
MKKFSILAPTMSATVASVPAFAETSYYSKAAPVVQPELVRAIHPRHHP